MVFIEDINLLLMKILSMKKVCIIIPIYHIEPTRQEIVSIQTSMEKLGTHDLSGYTLYATGYPCPMCLSAIIWANIKEVYYGTDLDDAEKIGFRDDFIYDYLHGKNKDILSIKQLDHEKCIKLFEEYSKKNKEIY